VSDTSLTKKEENFSEKPFVPLDTENSLIFKGKHKDATFDSKAFLANFSLSVKERVKQEYEHSISQSSREDLSLKPRQFSLAA
jgi:hypothetical protein